LKDLRTKRVEALFDGFLYSDEIFEDRLQMALEGLLKDIYSLNDFLLENLKVMFNLYGRMDSFDCKNSFRFSNRDDEVKYKIT